MVLSEQRATWLAKVGEPARSCVLRGVEVAEAVVANAHQAIRYWAIWESLNARLEPSSPMRSLIEAHDPPGLAPIRQALGEAAILATLRVSDNPKNDGPLSVCLLSGLLHNENVVEVLTSVEWITDGHTSLERMIHEAEYTAQPARIEWIKERVPQGWGKPSWPPENDELNRARNALKTFRDKRIAHTDRDLVDAPTVDELRQALKITQQVAEMTSLVFLGSTSALHCDSSEWTRQYDGFWHYFERGLSDPQQPPSPSRNGSSGQARE